MVSRNNEVWTFTFHHPNARGVWLLGDFNNWSTTATPMEQVGSQTWRVVLHLAQEVTSYCFFAWLPERGHGVIIGDTGDARSSVVRTSLPALSDTSFDAAAPGAAPAGA